MLRREDGVCLFYPGRVNGVHGDSGDGKTWAAEIALAQEMLADHRVFLIDAEDDETVHIERLRDTLGVPNEVLAERLHYYRPVAAFDDQAVEFILGEIATHEPTLIVMDSLGEFFGLEGVDEDRDVQVGPWLRRVARRLADAGPAVVLIDHSTKAKEAPLFPSGSKRKRAAITGASYLLDAPKPLTRERGGQLRLTCAKDRHGSFARKEVVAMIEFTVYPDGGLTVHVWPPTAVEASSSTPKAKLWLVAADAVRVVRDAHEPISQKRIVERMTTKVSKATRLAAIEEAVAAQALKVEKGDRGALLHTYVKDLPSLEQEVGS